MQKVSLSSEAKRNERVPLLQHFSVDEEGAVLQSESCDYPLLLYFGSCYRGMLGHESYAPFRRNQIKRYASGDTLTCSSSLWRFKDGNRLSLVYNGSVKSGTVWMLHSWFHAFYSTDLFLLYCSSY